MRTSFFDCVRRLRMWESEHGRGRGWFVERRGEVVAVLTQPRREEMFWDSYRMEIVTQDPELRQRLLTKGFWDGAEGEGLVWRSREFGEVAEDAYPSLSPFPEPGRLTVRGLYLPIGNPRPWERVALWLRRWFWQGWERGADLRSRLTCGLGASRIRSRAFGKTPESAEARLQYTVAFLVSAVAFVVAALAAWDGVGWAAVVPLYAAVSFALLATAYAGAGPRLLLKRASGRRSVLGWLLFAPYFSLNALTFALYRLLSREPAHVQVAPNLSFGRRLSAGEAGAAGWTSVLDLAGEFSAAWAPVAGGYRSLPVLDAAAPTEAELRSAVAWVTEAVAAGPVYVHCALGHGRSACVVIAYLLSVGAVGTVAEGVRLLRSLRPGVRLHPPQLRLLRRFEPQPATPDARPSAAPDPART